MKKNPCLQQQQQFRNVKFLTTKVNSGVHPEHVVLIDHQAAKGFASYFKRLKAAKSTNIPG
jgi:hypothetical protein